MILGVGVDVVDLEGFRAQLADGASRFVEGTFTAGERRAAESRASGDVARHLAARYAAKEAFVKAWSGSRFGLPPTLRTLDLREVEVVCDAWGRPSLRVGEAVERALRACGAWRAHLSLSHDGACAIGYVVLEGDQPWG